MVSDSLLVYLSSVGEVVALTPYHRELLLVTGSTIWSHVDTLTKFPFVAPGGRTMTSRSTWPGWAMTR